MEIDYEKLEREKMKDEGEKLGYEEGWKEGHEVSWKKGMENNQYKKLSIAKNLKNRGMSLTEISEITGLPPKDLRSLEEEDYIEIKLKIAQKLKCKGMPLNEISEITGLFPETIENSQIMDS